MGHHWKKGSASVLVYSREAYTSLYGRILGTFRTIQDSNYDPDLGPSSRVLQVADAVTGVSRRHDQVRDQPDVEEDGEGQGSQSSESGGEMDARGPPGTLF